MARPILTSILVAFLAATAWLGRTFYVADQRHAFLHRVFGTNATLNAAHPVSETALPCAGLEVLYVRGILEPGPLGFLLGPKLKRAVERRARTEAVAKLIEGPWDVVFLGLDHAANTEQSSMVEGVEMLISRVARRSAQCPDAKFALAGFSQGADVVRYALRDGLAGYKERVSSIVVFGDPLTAMGYPEYYTGRTLSLCHPGDRGCGGEGVLKHFTYGAEGNRLHEAATDFIFDRWQSEMPAGEGEAAVKNLPGMGDGGGFLAWWQEWPPADWFGKYGGGVVPPIVGLKGVENFDDIWEGFTGRPADWGWDKSEDY